MRVRMRWMLMGRRWRFRAKESEIGWVSALISSFSRHASMELFVCV